MKHYRHRNSRNCCIREALNKSAISHVVNINGMNARRKTQDAGRGGARTRYWRSQPFAGSAPKPPLPHLRYAIPGRGDHSTKPRSATPRASVYVATHAGTGFACGLQCQAPNKGNGHWCRRLSCIPSRKAECVAMWDWFRASLGQLAMTLFVFFTRAAGARIVAAYLGAFPMKRQRSDFRLA